MIWFFIAILSTVGKASACTYGEYYSSGDCHNCAPGMFQDGSPHMQPECKKCATGKYQDQTGKFSCTFCPLGKTQDTPGSAGCYNNYKGSSCRGGYSDTNNDHSICYSCPGGYYYEGHHAVGNKCKTCPNGYFSKRGGTSVIQDDDTYRYIFYKLPLICEPFMNSGGNCPFNALDYQPPTSCTECPIGQYIDKTGAAYCLSCPAGKETQSTGSIGDSNLCTDCMAGFYSMNPGFPCKACPTGYYQSGTGNDDCVSCEAGSSGPEGSSSSLNCFKCWAGEKELDGECLDCDVGTYSDVYGSTACTNCTAGMFAASNGSTACTDCTKGKYNDQTGQETCTGCVAGKFSNEIGSSDVSDCKHCTAGKFSTTGSSSCKDCTAGRYTNTNSRGSCNSCPTGFYAGSSGLSKCTECDAGKYEDITGSYSCKSCSPGKMSTTGMGACENCTIGRYSDVTQCSLCDEGKASGQGSPSASDCVACRTGTYSNENRTCTNCTVGTFQNEEGSAQCKACNVGRYGNYTADKSCTDCQHGKYQDEKQKTTCKSCTAGLYQNTKGNPACKHCVTGRYSKEVGAIISSVCIPYVENNILDNMEETCSLRVSTSGQGGLTKCPLFKEVVRSVSNSLIETTQYREMTLVDGSCSYGGTFISCFSPVETPCVLPQVSHDGICVDVQENPVRSDLENAFLDNGVSQED